MNPPIRLMLVEAETLVSEAICALLSKEAHLRLVGKADSAPAAMRKVHLLQPDVLLLDVHVLEGVGVIADLMRHTPALRILMLAAYAAEDELVAAFRAGAVGCIFKTQTIAEWVHTIEHIAWGETAIPAAVAHSRLCPAYPQHRPTAKHPLSEAELRVLPLVAQGFANKEIAYQLGVSQLTVSAHVSSILSKLHLTNRTQAVLYALKRGWVRLDELPTHAQQGPTGTLIAPYRTSLVRSTELQRSTP
jgi:two-component system, NarL family, response regulator LiaR